MLHLPLDIYSYAIIIVQVLDDFIKTLSHENDGLIFSPAIDVCLIIIICIGVCDVSVHSHIHLVNVTKY